MEATWAIAQDQTRAIENTRSQEYMANRAALTLATADDANFYTHYIYVYNVLDREYIVEQPPQFPRFRIPRCPSGQKFSFTVLPPYVLEPYNRAGTTEMYYKKIDGRKSATSLLNPSAYPGTKWESQLQNWEAPDQVGNNLNAFGVFWSLTKPDQAEQITKEVKAFKQRAEKTLNQMIRDAEILNAAGKLGEISPWQHFAMDYFGKQASWHMSSEHMIHCPNCGEMVKDGIAYHKNSLGDRCVIDFDRYKEMLRKMKAAEAEVEEDQGVPATVAVASEKGPAPRRKR